MSNADSEEFGKYLDTASANGDQQKIDLNPRRRDQQQNPFRKTRDFHGRHGVRDRMDLESHRNPSHGLRILTKQPINLHLRPPRGLSGNFRETEEGREQLRNGVLQRTPEITPAPPGIRIFSKSEVENIQLPKPPSSSGPSLDEPSPPPPNQHNATMRWRLRDLIGGDTATIRAPDEQQESESSRFTVGSTRTAGTVRRANTGTARSVASNGTTTALRRALDSEYIVEPRAEKRVKRNPIPQRVLADLEESSSLKSTKSNYNARDKGDSETGSLGIDFGGGGDGDGNNEEGAGSENALKQRDIDNRSQDEDLFVDRPSPPPSRLSSESLEITGGPPPEGTGAGIGARASSVDADQYEHEDERAARLRFEEEDRLRPREPNEIEAPLVFEVPVSDIPDIDWGAEDIDVDGTYLEQQLEHSESESEEESDAGSVAEMIDDDSEDEPFFEDPDAENKEWLPLPDHGNENIDTGLSSDESESDIDRIEALTESEDELEEDYVDPDIDLGTVARVSEARKERPKRARIPTVQFWLGERIEYVTDAKHQVMTAVDVRRVEPARKMYRRRRPYKRRNARASQLTIDDMEAEADQEAIQAPVFDTAKREWRDRTVAKSISGLEFAAVHADDGSRVPLVSQCILFGGKTESSPLRLLVLRIEPGGMYSMGAEQNKASTFVVWRGKCTVHLNNHEFDLTKGMACLVPRGNDLFVDNGSTDSLSTGDVYLFITEVDASMNPELADAMARDAQSMISGAAAMSNIFDTKRSSELDEEQVTQQEQIGESFNVGDNNLPHTSSPIQDGGASLQADYNEAYGFDPLDVDNGIDEEPGREADSFDAQSLARALGGSDIASTAADMQYRPAAPIQERRRRPELHSQRQQQAQPLTGHQFDNESYRSLSIALGGNSATGIRPTRDSRPLIRPRADTIWPPPASVSDEDSTGVLSDYLEGRKQGGKLVLPQRPVGPLAEFRLQRLLRRKSNTTSSNASSNSRFNN